MATLTIRNVPDPVHAAIRRMAEKHHRSAEAEVRAILTAVAAKELGVGLGQTLRARWGDALGDDLSNLRDQSPAEPAAFE
jgi:plasmid stability protein